MHSFDPAKDYYAVLGVPPTASPEAVRRAYRELAVRYHPDKHRGNALEELAAEKLAAVNEAYRVLSDPATRSAYDAARRGPAAGGGIPCAPNPPALDSRTLTRWLWLLVLVLTAPLWLRLVRNPRGALVAGAVAALLWLTTRTRRKKRS